MDQDATTAQACDPDNASCASDGGVADSAAAPAAPAYPPGAGGASPAASAAPFSGMYDDDAANSNAVPAAADAPPVANQSVKPVEKPKEQETAETVHQGVDAAEVVADTVAVSTKGSAVGDIASGIGKGAMVVGAGIGIADTINEAVNGEGCKAGDKAMGIVPLMGPLSTLMMPSWCDTGPKPDPNTGMTPAQEAAACNQSPVDPNNPPTCANPYDIYK